MEGRTASSCSGLSALGLPEVPLAFGVREMTGNSLSSKLCDLVEVECPDACGAFGSVGILQRFDIPS